MFRSFLLGIVLVLNHRPAGSRWVQLSAESPTDRAGPQKARSMVAAVYRHSLIAGQTSREFSLPVRCDAHPDVLKWSPEGEGF